ncbi:MAG: restriction endonuclease, partial [Halobacteriales archaeon]|nr:restriction endonuclease [Halobacteriales archaeon]
REDAVVRALKVGAATLRLSETSKDLEYVKREFESMQDVMEDEIDDVKEDLQEKFGDDGTVSRILEGHFGEDGTLRRHIERAFGEDGVFSERLDQELGEDGERIQSALDPSTEGTPTYQLQQTLTDEIQRVRDLLTEEAAREEVRQKTTLKGDDFETVVERLLDDLVYGTSHTYEYTGESEGELTDSKSGDFVIDLGDTDQRIVVEAKSEDGYTEPKIREQMERAIENRNADYGIFVSECERYVPDKVGYLKEFDRSYLAVALSRDEEDDVDPRLFQIGYNWAKMRAAQTAIDTGAEIDPEVVQSKVEEVGDSLDRFQSVKRKCTNIRENATAIDESLNEISDDVNAHLNDIRAELSKSES